MERKKVISLKDKIDYLYQVDYLHKHLATYKKKGKFPTKDYFQYFEKQQEKLKKLIQEQGFYTKQDWQNLQNNHQKDPTFPTETCQNVIQNFDHLSLDELLTPLVFNLKNISLPDYLTPQNKPLDQTTTNMVQYVHTLYLVLNEFNNYQKTRLLF